MTYFDYSTRSPYQLWDYVHAYRIKCFEPNRPMNARELKEATDAALAIRLDHLDWPEIPLAADAEWVTEQDFTRLEQWFQTVMGIEGAKEREWFDQQVEMRGQQEKSANHNTDFTYVDWYGTSHHFSLGIQSKAVAVLWGEWETTGYGLHQQTIGTVVGSESKREFRMDLTFRNHPAFGTMIQPCGNGIYGLFPPDSKPVKKTRRKPKRRH